MGCSSGVKCWEIVVSFSVIFSPFANKNNNDDVSSSLLHIYIITVNIILFVIIFWDEHLYNFPFMLCLSESPVFMQRTSTYFISCSISFPNFARKDHVSWSAKKEFHWYKKGSFSWQRRSDRKLHGINSKEKLERLVSFLAQLAKRIRKLKKDLRKDYRILVYCFPVKLPNHRVQT